MRIHFRRVLSMVAIAAIALHSALWSGTAARAAVPAFDPFSVICHSSGSADPAPDQAPANSAPGHACDHCYLCGSTPPPAASPASAVIQRLSSHSSYVLEPAPALPHGGVEIALKGARGPPVFA